MERLVRQPFILKQGRHFCLHQQFRETRAFVTRNNIQQQFKPFVRNHCSFQRDNNSRKYVNPPDNATKNTLENYRLWSSSNQGRKSLSSCLYSTAVAATERTKSQNFKQQQSSTSPLSSSTVELSPSDVDSYIVERAPVELSKEQRFLLNQVIEKKRSVFFTGSAGTGKSVLLRQLIEELKEKYKPGQVAVTASTGIAACNIGGCTLHAFAGVGLGQGTVEQLIVKLQEKKHARARWRKVKVLIIDEISMIDGETFDKFEKIARIMKKKDVPFGGIQLIITGDFFQLPPVQSSLLLEPISTSNPAPTRTRHKRGSSSTTTIIKRVSNDDKSGDGLNYGSNIFFDDYSSFSAPPPLLEEEDGIPETSKPTLCFDAKSWSSCIHSTLQLTEVFRQRDPVFINMLNEMRHGKVSEETCRIFRELKRTPDYPDDGIKATELFALRRQVDQANERYLAQLPGPIMLYEPMDQGPMKDLIGKASPAPTKLQLKENAQVMLIKNLTPTLVNGSMGLVVGFQEETVPIPNSQEWATNHFPIVRFQGEEDDIVIRPEEWRMELPNGDVIASRIQVPLILSWALSIHKSQGQTMDRVKVDMGKIFEAGQAYVALSRATSLAGLQVLNFKKDAIQAHERVGEFYDNLLTVQQLMEQEEAAALEKKMVAKTRRKRSPRKVKEEV